MMCILPNSPKVFPCYNFALYGKQQSVHTPLYIFRVSVNIGEENFGEWLMVHQFFPLTIPCTVVITQAITQLLYSRSAKFNISLITRQQLLIGHVQLKALLSFIEALGGK